jgi:hypothetical protein
MSDPNAILLPVNQALTSDMLLGLKPSAPKSRSYRISVAPLNASVFAPGSQMIFELPTGRKGTWLDQSQSYIKFSVQCSSANAVAANIATNGVYVENTAYSFIQRLDIYNSSNLLETINEYGQLANFLIDTQLAQSDKAGLSAMIGSNNIENIQSFLPVGVTIPASGVTTAAIPATSLEVQRAGDRSGMGMASVVNSASISTAIPYTFCLPVLSGVVGVNASKMMPVGKLNAPIRCEFYLAANDDAIYYGTAAGATTWQIVNAEFCLCYVELQDDSLDLVMQPGEQEYISTITYRQASTYLPAATAGEFTTLVPFRCASLSAIYARFRPYATATQGANATAAYRKSAAINPNLSSYYWRIGSSIYPNKPVYLLNGTLVGTGGEGYAELLKSFHALSASIGNTTLVAQQYNVAATATQGWTGPIGAGAVNSTAVGNHYNAFAVGLELQSFSNRSDTILSGISTLNSQVYFTGVVNTGATAGGSGNLNYTADFFGQLDMILVIQDGIMMAKF